MKLYTVWSGEYSDRGMTAVFSSMELAEAFVLEFDKKSGRFEKGEIIEYTMDEMAGAEIRQSWHCKLDKEGNLISARPDTQLATPQNRGYSSRFPAWSGVEFYGTSFISADHAIKLAAEERQSYLRESAEKEVVNRNLCEEANKMLSRK